MYILYLTTYGLKELFSFFSVLEACLKLMILISISEPTSQIDFEYYFPRRKGTTVVDYYKMIIPNKIRHLIWIQLWTLYDIYIWTGGNLSVLLYIFKLYYFTPEDLLEDLSVYCTDQVIKYQIHKTCVSNSLEVLQLKQ